PWVPPHRRTGSSMLFSAQEWRAPCRQPGPLQRRLRLGRREVRAGRQGDHRVRHHRPRRRLHIRSYPGGVGGIVEVAPGYLPLAYDAVRKAGGLCIADEVQAGFARVGSHFWGFETHGVIPDIVTMAKGIGNGIPLGAVVTTPEIAQVLTRRSYFNTFGGNPLCTAGGLAVLKVLDRERLQENAFIVGAYLKDRLRGLQEKHQIIGDVRGTGFMLGVELVTDRQLKTPAKDEICQAMEHMKDMGVLVGKGGFYGNVFRITPPLCFTKEDADFFVDVMDIALSKL
uniref:Uncharacterized protein n=1 Tax=Aegilops tauschii subsp. strangulata TaxID=200361 RepID=A0A453I557_AEGTS